MSKIGSHSLGKTMLSLRAMVSGGFSAFFSAGSKTIPTAQPYSVDGLTSDQLPRAPINPWRKRPIKLTYHKTEY